MTALQLANRLVAAAVRHREELAHIADTLTPQPPAFDSSWVRYDGAVADENEAYAVEITNLVDEYADAVKKRKSRRKRK